MEELYALFISLHAISLLLSILTTFIMFHAGQSVSYRLLRIASLVAGLVSFTVLFPMIPYGPSPDMYAPFLCWTQGYILHTCFLIMQTIGFLLSMHMFMLIVKNKHTSRKFYTVMLFGFPLIVLITVSIIIVTTRHMLIDRAVPPGVIPRSGYCFISYPLFIRLAGYIVPYALLSVPGMILSFWTAIYLIKYKISNPEKSLGVSLSTIYRMVFFTGFYTMATVMSFLPSMVYVVREWRTTGINVVEEILSYTEFSGSILGLFVFCVFGTGEHGKFVFRKYVQRK